MCSTIFSKSKYNQSIIKDSEIFQWQLLSKGVACLDLNDGVLHPNLNSNGLVCLVHDPWRPVPSVGGHLSPSPGKAIRTDIDKRGDVATFTSEPFTLDNYVQGIPILKIKANSDTDGFDLFIALSIILLNQTDVNQLSTGVIRVRGKDSKISRERIIKLQPILAIFPRGSQLRISIAGSAWPAIAINPGRIDRPCVASDPHSLITTISLNLVKANLKINPLFQK